MKESTASREDWSFEGVGARVMRPLIFGGTEALVKALRRGDPEAREILQDRYAPHVRRVLGRFMGAESDLIDGMECVFDQASCDIPKLRQPAALKGWLTMIAFHAAQRRIRTPSRRRWLRLVPSVEIPEQPSTGAEAEAKDHGVGG